MPFIAVPEILWEKLTEPGVKALFDLLNKPGRLCLDDAAPVLKQVLGEDGVAALIEVINTQVRKLDIMDTLHAMNARFRKSEPS